MTVKIPCNNKAIFYIDGQNLYHRSLEESEKILVEDCTKKATNELLSANPNKALNKHQLDSLVKEKFDKRKSAEIINSRLLDLRALCTSLAFEYDSNIEIIKIKYYGSQYPAVLDELKSNADHAYFRELDNNGIEFRAGAFLWDKEHWKKYKQLRNLREKGVDVKLAVDLITDLRDNQHCHSFVISQDTDLRPAFEVIKGSIDKLIHVRSVKAMKGFDSITDSNIRIKMSLLHLHNKALTAASFSAMAGLVAKHQK